MMAIVALSLALAADAAAVSAALAMGGASRWRVLQAAGIFGLFQGGMAATGSIGGAALSLLLGPGWTFWPRPCCVRWASG